MRQVNRHRVRALRRATGRVSFGTEMLESRRMLATAGGTVGNDIITVDISGVNIVVSVNGVNSNFSDAANNTITINGNGGNDTITVIRTGNNAVTINGGAGNDTINVGNGDVTAQLASVVTVDGGGDSDTVIYNDASAPSGGTYFVNGGTVRRSGAGEASTTNIEVLRLDASGQNDTINVVSTFAGNAYTINAGAGNDAIEIASTSGFGNLDSFINGQTSVNGGSGQDTITYNDTDATAVQTYILESSGFTTSTLDGVVIAYSNAELHHIVAAAGNLSQTFNLIESGGDNVSVTAGDGNDTINVGNGDFDSNFEDVFVNGGGGNDSIVIDDSSDAGATGWRLTSNSLGKPAANDDVVPTNVESMILNASGLAEAFTVESMNSLLAVTINAGSGNDTLIASADNDVDNSVTGSLRFNGDAGIDLIHIDDTADSVEATPEDYAVGSGLFEKSSATFGVLTFNSLSTEQLTLLADGDSSQIEIRSIGSNQEFTINAGAGDDDFTNNSLNEIGGLYQGNATLDGGLGTDRINFDDTGEDDAQAIDEFRISATAISIIGSGSSMLNYQSIDVILMAGSDNSTTFFVDSLPATTHLALNAGGGNDTITVGSGNLDDNGLGAFRVQVFGGSGTDRIIFNDSLDADVPGESESYNIFQPLIANDSLSKGASLHIVYGLFEQVQINGSSADSFYYADAVSVPTTIIGGSGDETLVTSDGDYDARILTGGMLTFDGSGGADRIEVVDDSVNTNDAYTIGTSSFGINGTNSISYVEVESFLLEASGGSNTINVTGTADNASYIVGGNGGNDTLNVGSVLNTVAPLLGNVMFFGGNGTDIVNYNDQGSAAPRTYTLTSGSILSPGLGNVAFATLVERVNINTSTAGDTVVISGVVSTLDLGVQVATGAGDDSIVIGWGNFDNTIDQNVTVLAGTGTDSLRVDDSSDGNPGDAYQINGDQFTDSGNPLVVVSYTADVETFRLDLPGGNERVTVNAPVASTVIVNGGAGNDTVENSGTAIDSFPNQLIFDGEAGTDWLELDNTGDVGINTVRFSRVDAVTGEVQHFNGLPHETIQYTNLEEIRLDDGASAAMIEITGLPQQVDLDINAGAGNDTLNVGASLERIDDVQGDVNFNGQAGEDAVVINDSASTVAKNWFIGSAGTGTSQTGSMFYSNAEAYTASAGTENDVINLNSTDPGMTYVVDAGGGNDVLIVGGTPADIDSNILSASTVRGGSGADSIIFADTSDTPDADTYTFTAAVFEAFSKTGSSTVTFSQFETRTLQANNGANTINVNNVLGGLLIQANGGVDDINLNDAVGIVTVSSGAGADRIDVDADNDANEVTAVFADSDEIQTFTIGAGSELNVPDGRTLVVTGSLVSGINGRLDLNRGYLVNRVGGTGVGSWRGHLTSGFAGGAWSGAGVNSSAAATTPFADGVGIRLADEANLPTLLNFGGVSVSPGDVLMSYTLNGDADLDRDVDFADLLALSQNYGFAGHWSQGDSNYDGQVTFPDLLALSQNYNASATPVRSGAGGSSKMLRQLNEDASANLL